MFKGNHEIASDGDVWMMDVGMLARWIGDFLLLFETLSSVCKFMKEVYFLESFIFL
jgi:hypothetical protein